MKKIKKFDDGGPTGGRFVDMGDSQVFVPDAPAPVAATMGQVPIGMGQDGPRVASQLAGLGGVAGGGGMLSGMDRPDVVARPMGLMMPPPNRRMSVPGAVPGTYVQGGMSDGMKKGGAVKKTTKVVKAKTATVRGHGIEQRGKTKGRFV